MNSGKDTAMDAIARANAASILDVASRLTTLKKIGREYYGPCPVCRAGTDRFYVVIQKNICGCRKCDKRWDSSGLYAAVYGLRNFDAALEMLGEKKAAKREYVPMQPAPISEEDDNRWKSKEWQREAAQIISHSADISPELFQDYVKARGLSDRTLEAFCIGFDPAKFDPLYGKVRPAMVIPWMGDDQIYAVKFRYMNNRDGLRYLSFKHGKPLVFGEHLLVRHDVLVLVEGEINDMSVWQAFRDKADVLSVGGDSNDPAKEYAKAIAINRGYDLIIPWFDELKKAQQIRETFEGFKVRPIHSINGMDANDVHVQLGETVLRSILQNAVDHPDTCPYCHGTEVQILGRGKIAECICSRSSN